MKKYILILLILSVILLTSCKGGTSSGDGRTEVKLQEGTQGLTVSFLEKGVPKEVVETDNFFTSLKLQNEGFSDIEEGLLIMNLEKDLVQLEDWDLPEGFFSRYGDTISFNLKGKNLVNLIGESQITRAILQTKGIPPSLNKIDSIISITACYPYKTVFSGTICVDTDPNDLSVAQKTCEVKDIETSRGQGAPVSITKIEQKIIPGDSRENVRIQFTIFAKNQGKGTIIRRERYEDVCLGENIEKDDFNAITLTRFQFSGYEYRLGQDYEIECSPNPLKEEKQEFWTRCTLKPEESLSKALLTFETPLVIELSYGYQETLTEKISIVNKNANI